MNTLKNNEKIISFKEMTKEEKLYFIKYVRKSLEKYRAINIREFYNDSFMAYVIDGKLKGIAEKL